jgi:preprotein translocase subunit SecB
MLDAYLLTAEVLREAIDETQPSEPKLDVAVPSLQASHGHEDDQAFTVAVGAAVEFAFRPDARLVLRVTVAGEFYSSEPLDPKFATAFAEREGLVLLWPFLRAQIAQLAALTHISIPILPTLDVRAARFAQEVRGARPARPKSLPRPKAKPRPG